jgi:hypothetical protein
MKYLTTKQVLEKAAEYGIAKYSVMGDIQRNKLVRVNENAPKNTRLFLQETVFVYLEDKKARNERLAKRKNKTRNPVDRKNTKNAKIWIRVTDEEKEELKFLAKLSETKGISEFVRHLIKEAKREML